MFKCNLFLDSYICYIISFYCFFSFFFFSLDYCVGWVCSQVVPASLPCPFSSACVRLSHAHMYIYVYIEFHIKPFGSSSIRERLMHCRQADHIILYKPILAWFARTSFTHTRILYELRNIGYLQYSRECYFVIYHFMTHNEFAVRFIIKISRQ